MSRVNIEMKILDEDWRRIGFWKFGGKDIAKFLRIINFKHDLGITVKEKKQKDTDLDWAT